VRLGLLAEARGESGDEHFAEALRDADEALRLAPDREDVREDRAEALLGRARAAAQRGDDARRMLAEAVAEYDTLLSASPDSVTALEGRASARSNLGVFLTMRGEDAGTAYELALADLDACLRIRPNRARMLLQRSIVQLNEAERRARRGGAADEFRRAIADAEAAIRLLPSLAEAHHHLGMSRGGLLNHLRGVKPREDPDLRALATAAVDAFTESLQRNPQRVESLWRRGMVRYQVDDLRGALDDFEKSLAADARLEKMLRPFIENIKARMER
jgi:tetratricopeptide (TPR) repeat protein